MRGCSRGDCGAVGGNAVGVTVVLLEGMLSGCQWCCWRECCRGDCGAVGGNAVGKTVGCEDAVGVAVVLLGGMLSG